jgi:putative polyketide hydroxylase
MSTLDLLGPGFSLLTGDEEGGWAGAAASAGAARGGPIPIPVVHIGVRGDADDPNGEPAAATELGPDGALLVRPDGFGGVAGRETPRVPW